MKNIRLSHESRIDSLVNVKVSPATEEDRASCKIVPIVMLQRNYFVVSRSSNLRFDLLLPRIGSFSVKNRSISRHGKNE